MNTRYENSTGSDGVICCWLFAPTPPEPPRRHRPERRQSRAWSTSVRFGLGMLLLCGLAYPAVSVLISSNAFPQQAGGSLIRLGDKQVGSALVAQPFSSGKYLQPRPSTSGYDPMAMAGSDLAPSNPELRKQVALRVAVVAKREGVPPSDVPVDLVFALVLHRPGYFACGSSASGRANRQHEATAADDNKAHRDIPHQTADVWHTGTGPGKRAGD